MTDKPRSWKRPLILAIKLVVTVLVFWWLFGKSDISLAELLDELKRIEPARFIPWLGLAVAVKLVGIFANIWRWQLLLKGQELMLRYGFLAGSFFIGRFFGIVTPGTLGLDGFKLYDTIRVTRKPVPCAAVIVIDKVIGLVGLASLLVIVFPVGWRVLPGFDEGKALILVAGMIVAPARRVALGADHGGFAMKEALRPHIQSLGFTVEDCGPGSADAVDYPD